VLVVKTISCLVLYLGFGALSPQVEASDTTN